MQTKSTTGIDSRAADAVPVLDLFRGHVEPLRDFPQRIAPLDTIPHQPDRSIGWGTRPGFGFYGGLSGIGTAGGRHVNPQGAPCDDPRSPNPVPAAELGHGYFEAFRNPSQRISSPDTIPHQPSGPVRLISWRGTRSACGGCSSTAGRQIHSQRAPGNNPGASHTVPAAKLT